MRTLQLRALMGLLALLILVQGSAGIAAENPSGEINEIEVVNAVDADGDGRHSASTVEVSGDLQVSEHEIGDEAGDPYLRVLIGDQQVHRTGILSSDNQTAVIQVPRSALEDISPGQRTVRVELVDKDGDFDTPGYVPDLNSDGVRDSRTVSLKVEPTTVRVEAVRKNVSTGTTISLNGSFICQNKIAGHCIDSLIGGNGGELRWHIADRPAGSKAEIRAQSGKSATFRPDTAGNFTLTASPADNPDEAGTTVTIHASNTSNWSLVRRYAPVVHFARGTEYYPTRYEAFFTRARPDTLWCDYGVSWFCNGDVVTYDLGGDSSISGLVLDEPVRQYRRDARETRYPATIYGSVNRDVTYRSTEYTAVTYWFFYLNDPKPEDSIGQYGLDHQSDVETVTVLRNASGPQYVVTSQHYGGEIREWEKAPTQGTHVHVYPAVGAHSNYLTNSQLYQGAGFYPQAQFMQSGSESASVWSAVVNNAGGPATELYHDETGNSTTWRPSDYQLALLTAREVWADYEGRLGTGGLAGEGGKVATQRTRWRNLSGWLETQPLPDEVQLDAAFESSRFEIGEETVRAEASVVNGAAVVAASIDGDIGVAGMKPHRFWVVLEAKPESASWNNADVRLLDSRPVRVGTGESRSVTVEGRTPSNGEWDYRIRLLLYEPAISEEEDVTGIATPILQ